MSSYDGQIDSPPPSRIAERFGSKFAEAITEFHRDASVDGGRMLTEACSAEVNERLDQAIAGGRLQLIALLDEATRCTQELSEALGVRQWRDNPTHQFKPMPLMAYCSHRTTGLSARSPGMSAAKLIAEIQMIALSPNGTVDLNRPGPQLRIEDFTKPGMAVRTSYQQAGDGFESADRRIVGGRGMAA